MYEQVLTLNNLEGLVCHKTQPTYHHISENSIVYSLNKLCDLFNQNDHLKRNTIVV